MAKVNPNDTKTDRELLEEILRGVKAIYKKVFPKPN